MIVEFGCSRPAADVIRFLIYCASTTSKTGVISIDNPKYTNFSFYSDELADELMDDSALMEFMQCAIDTNNPAQVLDAAKMIVTSRDNREIAIRRLGDDLE